MSSTNRAGRRHIRRNDSRASAPCTEGRRHIAVVLKAAGAVLEGARQGQGLHERIRLPGFTAHTQHPHVCAAHLTQPHAHALPTPARGSCSAHGKALCTAPVYARLVWTLLRVLLDYHRVMWSTHPSVLDDSAVLPLTADRTLLPALCRSLCTPCLFRPCGTCGSTDRSAALTPP